MRAKYFARSKHGRSFETLRPIRPRPSSRYVRQSFQLHLSEVSLRDVGSFLGHWRARDPLWTPTRIELFHVRNQPRPGRLYSARIELPFLDGTPRPEILKLCAAHLSEAAEALEARSTPVLPLPEADDDPRLRQAAADAFSLLDMDRGLSHIYNALEDDNASVVAAALVFASPAPVWAEIQVDSPDSGNIADNSDCSSCSARILSHSSKARRNVGCES